jgi:hypothetical protein
MAHHITLVLDKTKSAGNQVALSVDDEFQSPFRRPGGLYKHELLR